MIAAASVRVRYALLVAVATLSFSFPAAARMWRPGQIPNGHVFDCATCHNNNLSRNPFGLAVEALVTPGSQDPFWGPALAALDSDGDGFTNGQELGDPDGDGTPVPGALVTHPGNPNSKPGPFRITETSLTDLGFKLAWTNGMPPFVVQQKLLTPGAEWTDILTTDGRSVTVPREGAGALLRVQSNPGRSALRFTALPSGTAENPKPVSRPKAAVSKR